VADENVCLLALSWVQSYLNHGFYWLQHIDR
jgi:hypothetical protein